MCWAPRTKSLQPAVQVALVFSLDPDTPVVLTRPADLAGLHCRHSGIKHGHTPPAKAEKGFIRLTRGNQSKVIRHFHSKIKKK